MLSPWYGSCLKESEGYMPRWYRMLHSNTDRQAVSVLISSVLFVPSACCTHLLTARLKYSVTIAADPFRLMVFLARTCVAMAALG